VVPPLQYVTGADRSGAYVTVAKRAMIEIFLMHLPSTAACSGIPWQHMLRMGAALTLLLAAVLLASAEPGARPRSAFHRSARPGSALRTPRVAAIP